MLSQDKLYIIVDKKSSDVVDDRSFTTLVAAHDADCLRNAALLIARVPTYYSYPSDFELYYAGDVHDMIRGAVVPLVSLGTFDKIKRDFSEIIEVYRRTLFGSYQDDGADEEAATDE